MQPQEEEQGQKLRSESGWGVEVSTPGERQGLMREAGMQTVLTAASDSFGFYRKEL